MSVVDRAGAVKPRSSFDGKLAGGVANLTVVVDFTHPDLEAVSLAFVMKRNLVLNL